ncbi:helix-turn-helix transcriptional regulator [Kribbella sp. NPDC050459]|uniref:PadR family transcriptional regulator n=1 Tax=Kribbella sp. NPDC050459 TaxID=3155785 RepID=UPI00340AB913
MAEPRITVPTLKVLQALIEAEGSERMYGLELMDRTGLKSGTLYPVLARLERAGWVESTWEDVDPRDAGRPRRRFYRLTGLGQRTSTAELSQLTELPLPRQPRGQTPPRPQRPAWGQA